MNTTKYIPGYKVEISYTPDSNEDVEVISKALKIVEKMKIKVEQTGLYLNPQCRRWLKQIIEPIKQHVEFIMFDDYITIGLKDKDDISLPYSNKLPFYVPNTGSRQWTLEELNLEGDEYDE